MHPYAYWERGLSEYSYKLIRQCIQKQTNFDNFEDSFIKQVQHKVNRRPRKNLGFNTPKYVFFNYVAFASLIFEVKQRNELLLKEKEVVKLKDEEEAKTRANLLSEQIKPK